MNIRVFITVGLTGITLMLTLNAATGYAGEFGYEGEHLVGWYAGQFTMTNTDGGNGDFEGSDEDSERTFDLNSYTISYDTSLSGTLSAENISGQDGAYVSPFSADGSADFAGFATFGEENADDITDN